MLQRSSSAANLLPDPVLQPAQGDNLLHVGRQLANLDAPLRTTGALLHIDRAPADVPLERPARAAGELLGRRGLRSRRGGRRIEALRVVAGLVDGLLASLDIFAGEDFPQPVGELGD